MYYFVSSFHIQGNNSSLIDLQRIFHLKWHFETRTEIFLMTDNTGEKGGGDRGVNEH